MGCLTFCEISGMNLPELLEQQENLPPEIDVSTLTEENFSLFQENIEYLVLSNPEPNTIKELKQSLEMSYPKYFAAGFGGIFPTLWIHELGHALGAMVTGGNVHGFEMSGQGICTIVSTPNDFSYASTLLAPNVIMPLAGFYLMRKGFEEKRGEYVGAGVCMAFGGVNYVPWHRGDFFSLVDYFAELPETQVAAVSIALVAGTYAFAYCASDYLRKMEKRVFKKES